MRIRLAQAEVLKMRRSATRRMLYPTAQVSLTRPSLTGNWEKTLRRKDTYLRRLVHDCEKRRE
jgi:hypothetical protein